MDQIKKRKLDENGLTTTTSPQPDPITGETLSLSQSDARSILEPFTADQLREILTTAIITHSDILASVRSIADRDVTQRKLFIRGLGWETTSESLRSIFSPYGELEEAVVILDKQSGKSKGYGFVIFKHIDGAMLALKQSSKMIDGRIAVAALASAGLAGGPRGSGGGGGGGVGGGGGGDTSMRKIFVGNVPQEMPVERLLSVFSCFGEIEEGPLGFDKGTGKSKGFAMFVYKTIEGAHAALAEPMKVVDGRALNVKLANDGKKGKVPGGPMGESMSMQAPPNAGVGPAGVGGPYGGPPSVGYSSYNGYSGMGQNPNNTMNPPYNSSVGGQGPGGYGGNPGYGGYETGAGYGGGSQYNAGPNSGGYGGYGGAGSGGAGRGGYGMPPNAGGPPVGGGYSEGGPYGGPSAGGYSSQQYQPVSTSPAPRGPPGGPIGFSHPPHYF